MLSQWTVQGVFSYKNLAYICILVLDQVCQYWSHWGFFKNSQAGRLVQSKIGSIFRFHLNYFVLTFHILNCNEQSFTSSENQLFLFLKSVISYLKRSCAIA